MKDVLPERSIHTIRLQSRLHRGLPHDYASAREHRHQMFFKKIFRAVKRAAFGRVVRRIDTDIASMGNMKVSLRLKTEREGPYVVLALIAPGNYQYFPMDIDELDAVIKAMGEIRTAAADFQNSNGPTKGASSTVSL